MSPLDEAIIANDQLPEQQRESNVKLGARFGVSEAAVRLGITPQAVRDRITSGRLPGRKVGRNWVVSDAVLPR